MHVLGNRLDSSAFISKGLQLVAACDSCCTDLLVPVLSCAACIQQHRPLIQGSCSAHHVHGQGASCLDRLANCCAYNCRQRARCSICCWPTSTVHCSGREPVCHRWLSNTVHGRSSGKSYTCEGAETLLSANTLQVCCKVSWKYACVTCSFHTSA